MTRKPGTKRALAISLLCLLLCCGMLTGTTFAWFTDTAVSGTNVIAAGNLDIALTTADGTDVSGLDSLFSDVKLWEPGAVAVETLTVSNVGSLTLQYQLSVNFDNENTVSGLGLSDILQVAVIPAAVTVSDRQALVSSISGWTKLSRWVEKGKLAAGDSDTYTVVVCWLPSETDNNWNANKNKATSDGDPLHIDLGVYLSATQMTEEQDSFGSDYDDVALVSTDEQLQAALDAAAGGEKAYIMLGADITVTQSVSVPDGSNVTLDLNGHILQNPVDSAVAASQHIIVSYGDLTIVDSAENKGAVISNNYLQVGNTRYGGFAVKSMGGKLVIDGAALDGNNWSYVVYAEGGSVQLTDANVTGRGCVYICAGAHADIYSGSYSIDVLTTNARDNVVFLDDATANIYGGSFDGMLKQVGTNDTFNWKGSSCLMLCGRSQANVYGGSFEAREADLFVHDRYCAIYVYGGSFNTVNVLGNDALHEHQNYPDTCIIEVRGGSFVYDPAAHLGDGFSVTLTDGRYIVAEK